MPLVIPPGFGQASFEFSNAGDPESWYMTLGVDLDADTTPWIDSADSLVSAMAQTISLGMSTSTTFVGVHLAVGQDGGPPLRVFSSSGVTGSSASDKLPQNSAVLIQKNTARAGRTGRGRMYVPNWIDEGKVDNVGRINTTERSALQTIMQDFYGELTNPVTTVPVPPVLLHNGGVPGGTTPTPIISFTVDPVIATQRRRLRR